MKNIVVIASLSLIFIAFGYAETDSLENILAFTRNEVFARHGRPFVNPDYQKYFEQFNWYHSNPEYSDDLLSDSDRRDIGIILKYERELPNLSLREKTYLREIVETMRKFRYISEGFTVEKSSDITGDGDLDLLKSNALIIDDSVLCKSQIISKNKVIWEEQLVNPYLWLGESPLFYADESDIWVRFYIASKHAVPEIHTIDDYHISFDMQIKMGIMDLTENGQTINIQEYKDYLVNYKGKILWHGEPETSGELLIWFSPLNRFILFYSD